MDVLYAFGQMDNSSKSTESVMALNENRVRADSPESAQRSAPVRTGRFANVLYTVERILSTLSRPRLEDLCCLY